MALPGIRLYEFVDRDSASGPSPTIRQLTNLLPRNHVLGCVDGEAGEEMKSGLDQVEPLSDLDDGGVRRKAWNDGIHSARH